MKDFVVIVGLGVWIISLVVVFGVYYIMVIEFVVCIVDWFFVIIGVLEGNFI